MTTRVVRLARWRVVLCEACLDRGRVWRIHGGVKFPEPCPDCSGGVW